jgi:hypothetical protein
VITPTTRVFGGGYKSPPNLDEAQIGWFVFPLFVAPGSASGVLHHLTSKGKLNFGASMLQKMENSDQKGHRLATIVAFSHFQRTRKQKCMCRCTVCLQRAPSLHKDVQVRIYSISKRTISAYGCTVCTILCVCLLLAGMMIFCCLPIPRKGLEYSG